MRRFFVNPNDIEEKKARIFGEEYIHITKVLRTKVNTECILLDGLGYEYQAIVSDITSDSVLFDISEKRECESEPRTKVTLYQGLPKSMKMDVVVQKCVELGVNSIVAFTSKRCVKMPDKNFDKKIQRMDKIAKEAVKQCKRGIIPKVTGCIIFSELVKKASEHELSLVCYEEEKTLSLKQVLRQTDASDIAIIIGTEGGFEQDEIDRMKEAGVKSVSLGKRILRSETAGMATLAMIMYEKDEI